MERINRRKTTVAAGLVAAALALVGSSLAFAQSVGAAPWSGTIASIRGGTVTLTLADGSQREVHLQPDTLVLERDAASVGDLRAGQAMGVAARRSGPELIATSINIFSSELWDVVRKGQWPMSTGEVMTNAVVTDTAAAVSGHTLTMNYKEVTARITVPDGIPVHRLVTVKPAALTAGMQISVRGTPASDGTLKAASVNFDGPGRG